MGELGEGGDDRPGEVLSPRFGTSIAADIFSYNTKTNQKFKIQRSQILAAIAELQPGAGFGVDTERYSLCLVRRTRQQHDVGAERRKSLNVRLEEVHGRRNDLVVC